MIINKENESKFQFSEPRTDICIFIVNSSSSCENIPVKLTRSIQLINDESNSRMVSLNLEAGEQGNEAFPFYLKFTESAIFKWEEDSFDDNTIKGLLEVNAPTLLLSYMRPLVYTITSQSIHGAFHIPFIDLSEGVGDYAD